MTKINLFFSRALTSLLAVLFALNACSPTDLPKPNETPQNTYEIDSVPLCNTSCNLDTELLDNLTSRISEGDFGNIHSLIILYKDKLAMEEYSLGWTRHMRHYCMSASKSFASALIGIALDEGIIDSVDEKLLDLLPEYDDIANPDVRKESITLENVLSMSAGFEWDERSEPLNSSLGLPNMKNDVVQTMLSSDWIKHVLDLPMNTDPGTQFVYNSGCSLLLSGIINHKSGQSVSAFSEEKLFTPLGIDSWQWLERPDGITETASSLSLHPVNMAMLGYLYLKKGKYNGTRILSEQWVDQSTAKHIIVDRFNNDLVKSVDNNYDYGYQWWRFSDSIVESYLETNDVFFALGIYGQFIFVIPHLDLVVVMTAGNLDSDYAAISFEMLFDYIVPAINGFP